MNRRVVAEHSRRRPDSPIVEVVSCAPTLGATGEDLTWSGALLSELQGG